MQVLLGWIIIVVTGALFIAQLISSINFKLAQHLGIQEATDSADPLLLRAERYTAYWDLLTLIWMPVSGVLMVLNYSHWPYFLLIGSVIYIDASGREAAKNLSFKHHGLKTGSRNQRTIFFASYIIMLLVGISALLYSLNSLML